MPYADLYIARKQCQALRDLVLQHKGGGQDESALKRFLEVLKGAEDALSDEECKRCLRSAAAYARDLFSESGHAKWARPSTSGPDFLRLQMLRELDYFKRRLSEIEATRIFARHGDITVPRYETKK